MRGILFFNVYYQNTRSSFSNHKDEVMKCKSFLAHDANTEKCDLGVRRKRATYIK